jgi:hypothetical protein
MRLLLALSLLVATQAQALLVTLDPDDFAVGADVSQAIDGVTLSRVFWASRENYTRSPLTVRDCMGYSNYCGSPTGLHDFGGGSGLDVRVVPSLFDMSCCYLSNPVSVVEIAFDSPTNHVSLVMHMIMDHGVMVALDSDDNILAVCRQGLNSECPVTLLMQEGIDSWHELVTLETEEENIARILFGGYSAAARLGAITVSVPEPGTLGLLGIGIFGIGLSRRIGISKPLSDLSQT